MQHDSLKDTKFLLQGFLDLTLLNQDEHSNWELFHLDEEDSNNLLISSTSRNGKTSQPMQRFTAYCFINGLHIIRSLPLPNLITHTTFRNHIQSQFTTRIQSNYRTLQGVGEEGFLVNLSQHCDGCLLDASRMVE